MSNVELPAYLARIGYRGSIKPTRETLRELHRAHLFTVPFENLDIGWGRKIVCDEASFLRKVVEERRGGFCYELNGAFAALLRGLGFKVTLLSARVARADGTLSQEFDHLALRMDLDEPWLADVGFGESFLEPLRLQPDRESQGYRIVQELERWHVERREPDGGWKRQYAVTLTPRTLEDFAPMCHYHQSSPDSHFTQNRVCTKATPTGRITLTKDKLILTRNGVREEKPLSSDQEWKDALREHFGIAAP